MPLGQRMAAMQSTVRAVIGFDQNLSAYGLARYGVSEIGSR